MKWLNIFIVNGFINAGISTSLDSDDSSSGSELDGCDHSSASDESCEFTDSEDVSSMEDLTLLKQLLTKKYQMAH